jgi:hypothetical protein
MANRNQPAADGLLCRSGRVFHTIPRPSIPRPSSLSVTGPRVLPGFQEAIESGRPTIASFRELWKDGLHRAGSFLVFIEAVDLTCHAPER